VVTSQVRHLASEPSAIDAATCRAATPRDAYTNSLPESQINRGPLQRNDTITDASLQSVNSRNPPFRISASCCDSQPCSDVTQYFIYSGLLRSIPEQRRAFHSELPGNLLKRFVLPFGQPDGLGNLSAGKFRWSSKMLGPLPQPPTCPPSSARR
jgi:hypothetical protein